MQEIIFKLIHMSMQASIVIFVVLMARFCMQKLPRKYSYLLWFVVGFRLLCPLEIRSRFSLFNLSIFTQLNRDNVTKREPVATVVVPQKEAVVQSSFLSTEQIFMILWIVGMLVLAGVALYKYCSVRNKLASARHIKDNMYESSFIKSPFVIGIVNPKIYLPIDMKEEERTYLIMHEKVHISRGDYITKIIGYLAVVIHWFNPVVWIAFMLFCQDMEMRCDEIVIDKLGNNIKKGYSLSLVSFAMKSERQMYTVVAQGFCKKSIGGMEVKMRIKNVLKYKKTSKIVAGFAFAGAVALTVVCTSSAETFVEEKNADTEVYAEATYDAKDEAVSQAEAEAAKAAEEEVKRKAEEEAKAAEEATSKEVYAVKMDDSEVKSKVSPKKGEYVVEVTEINGKKHTFAGKKN